MVSKSFTVVLSVTIIHLVSGESWCILFHISLFWMNVFWAVSMSCSASCWNFASGMTFMSPEPDTPPTSTPDTYPLGDLIHAALRSKEYLGESSGTFAPALTVHCSENDINCSLENGPLAGTTTNPTQAVPGLGRAESTATVISPGLLTTALSSSAASHTGARNPMSPLSIEEETTTTLITTTTITTMHVPGITQRKLCVHACVCVRAEWTHKVTIQPAALERVQFSAASTSNFNRMTLRHNFCLCLKKNYGLVNKVTWHITWNINDKTASYNNQLNSMAYTIYTFKVACFCITVVLQLIFF